MNILFNIKYRTNWGEELRVTGNVPELGNNKFEDAIPLHTTNGIDWGLEKKIALPEEQVLTYTYCLFHEGKLARKEWASAPRTLRLSDAPDRTYYLKDFWKNLPENLHFYSSAFTDALLTREKQVYIPADYGQTICIKADAPNLSKDFQLAIAGNQEILGNWSPEKACIMNDADFPQWQIEIDTQNIKFPLEYKFVLLHKESGNMLAWENSYNRVIEHILPTDNETNVVSNQDVNFNLPLWKGSGTAVPVFSLRSNRSFGVGDFGDLKQMVDWVILTEQKIIQILPINDTTITHTWMDSYPYNSISIYAFHPIYIDLNKLPELKDKEISELFNKKQEKFNALPEIDYEAVEQGKWAYIKLVFEQEGVETLVSDQFRSFFEDNKEWLKPYAAFSYLRDLYHTANFREWPEYSTFNIHEIEQLCLPNTAHYSQIAIYYYIQYHLHLQLLEASEYARAHGVVLKGDIPIGINRNSVEAWVEPFYFNLNGQAGAPPDDFSINGQNWGFPTYNWDVMEKDGYQWWMKRFKKMSEYFDAYRIDHILGFFRIWEIPLNAVHGLLGQFSPALPMSCEEIEGYGLPFREEFLTPLIHESFLSHIFGPHLQYVKQTFIEYTDRWGFYRMRDEFDTQRKIEAFFAERSDKDSIWIRDGLYSLISNVLFLRDHKNENLFHPRISAQLEFAYQFLSQPKKDAFNRLYDHFYYHRHNEFWYQQAMKKLPQLTQSTRMLVCGEDLGMIPDSVATAMNDLRILSLEVQRMPKDSSQEFGNPYCYPYRSVCTFSTHDMSTLRGWWEEERDCTQRYYNHVLGLNGEAPSTATPELCETVLQQLSSSSSMLTILALQDWLSIDGHVREENPRNERINIPSNPKHYWRYRMHISIEELLKSDVLNNKIKRIIQLGGRDRF